MELPVVSVNEGKIRGNQRININEGKFYSFLGIPYAKTPVGNLRFKAPEPIEPWKGVKDGTVEGHSCYQRNPFTSKLEGSEDCLNLNVFTKTLPFKENNLKPVMVYIHGGAFLFGSNLLNLNGPENLMTEDIVLVTINYRLGYLGFLQLNDVSLNVPGNAGLKDQRLALKWIQKNVKQFNGDPGNITIFGNSAGSASVNYHLVSPTSKGLFHKAILQSGTIMNPWVGAARSAIEFAQSIKTNIKSEEEILELLKNMPVEQLYLYQEKFLESNGTLGVLGPVVEQPNISSFIKTSSATEPITSGQFNQVPILLGYCEKEGIITEAIQRIQEAGGVKPLHNFDMQYFVHPHLNLKTDDPNREIIVNKIVQFYLQEENGKGKTLLITDFLFVMGVIGSAKLFAKMSSHPVYLYRFSLDAGLGTYKKVAGITEPGACHADEVGYLFNIPLVQKYLQKEKKENLAIKQIVSLWTNFARTGNPTPDGNGFNIVWKPVNTAEVHFMDIGEKLTMCSNPEPERIKFWKEIFNLSQNTFDYL